MAEENYNDPKLILAEQFTVLQFSQFMCLLDVHYCQPLEFKNKFYILITIIISNKSTTTITIIISNKWM